MEDINQRKAPAYAGVFLKGDQPAVLMASLTPA